MAYTKKPKGAVLTDQTTPQTVSNGRITFSDGIKLGTTPTVGTFEAGKMHYDSSRKTVSVMIDDDITLQIGQEEMVLCYNNTGTDIANGKIVYPTGANGDMPTIALAKADQELTSRIIGMTTQIIPNGHSGFVTVRGIIHNLNTGTFISGDDLYLSTTTAGEITNIPTPDSSMYLIKIGVALIIDSLDGSIQMRTIVNNRLVDLVDVSVVSPVTDQILVWNGAKWINGNQRAISAGAGIAFYLDSTSVIPSGTQTSVGLETLHKYPSGSVQEIEDVTVSNSTAIIDRYIYDTPLGRTVIDAGAWVFNTFGYVSNQAGTSSIPISVYKVVAGTGTISISGTAGSTSRTATITGSTGTPFSASDVNADITLCGWLQTPTAVLRITGFTSATQVTVQTLSTYVNESSVSYSIHKFLFTDATTEINNEAVALTTSKSVQPSFVIDLTDKLAITYFARTSSSSNKTLYLYHGGINNYTYFETPLAILHNEIAGIQGGLSDEKYHLDLTKYNVVQNTNGTNTGDVTLGTASGLSLLSQQLSLGVASSGVTGALSGTDWNTFNDKVPYSVLTDTKDPTGWLDPTAVDNAMTYDSTTQKISITGTHYYYWRGVKKSITNFVSTAHTNTVGNTYRLYSTDGDIFIWSTNMEWAWTDVMLASVNYQTAYKYATAEPHGLMPWQSHEEFHRTIGTYKESGGTLDPASYTLLSTTPANRRPNVVSTVVHDEDIEHILSALTTKTYNKFYLSSANTVNFTGLTAEIVPVLANNPYYNSFATPNWTQVLMANNSYSSVWLVAQPMTQDANSQAYRYLWIQGQSNGALAVQQGLTPADVNFGALAGETEEFVFLVKIIIRYTGGNWHIESVTNLNGNRFIQTGTASGTYLSVVTTDATLTGDGSTGNPLSVVATGGMSITEVEIDFGSSPVYGKDFTITDATVSSTSKIIAYLSGNTATGRVGNDFTWDSLSLSAVAGTGNFVLSALSTNGSLVGNRKIYYNVIQ
jgi:hypothetical protein